MVYRYDLSAISLSLAAIVRVYDNEKFQFIDRLMFMRMGQTSHFPLNANTVHGIQYKVVYSNQLAFQITYLQIAVMNPAYLHPGGGPSGLLCCCHCCLGPGLLDCHADCSLPPCPSLVGTRSSVVIAIGAVMACGRPNGLGGESTRSTGLSGLFPEG